VCIKVEHTLLGTVNLIGVWLAGPGRVARQHDNACPTQIAAKIAWVKQRLWRAVGHGGCRRPGPEPVRQSGC
jgi:hypothetical protein